MTAPAADAAAARLEPGRASAMMRLLESGFTGTPSLRAVLAHQYLLAALDRGEHDRFLVWPASDPVGVLYVGMSGTIVPAGDPVAAAPLAEAASRTAWRVLVGDAALGLAILDAYPRGVFRRRPNAREQRLMAVWDVDAVPGDGAVPHGFRAARRADVDDLVELACRLHVEDRMGPPIPRTGRGGVRARMLDSVARTDTWVVERRRRVVAKVDVSLRSARRGAQLAGVYVDARWRGQGIAGGAVAALSRVLLADGAPGVTLHVRADNAPAIAAYVRAGLVDQGAWTLAIR